METKSYIYALIDPRDDCIKYIGKSHNPKDRLSSHIYEAKKKGKKNKVRSWIFSLLNKNLRPILLVIDSAQEKEIYELEKFYILYFRLLGIDLKNINPGGEGQPKGSFPGKRYVPPKGFLPPAARKSYFKGKKFTKEHCENMSKVRLGKPLLKLRKKIIATNLLTNEEIVFDSLKSASNSLGIDCSHIGSILHKRTATAKGFTFRYFNEEKKVIKTEGQGIKRKVIRIDGSEEKVYNSKLEAAKDVLGDRSGIDKAIKLNRKYRGYNWKYG